LREEGALPRGGAPAPAGRGGLRNGGLTPRHRRVPFINSVWRVFGEVQAPRKSPGHVDPDQTRTAVELARSAASAVPPEATRPAWAEVGHGLRDVVHNVFARTRLKRIKNDHAEAILLSEFAQELEAIAPEKRVDPDPMIAGPLLDALPHVVHHEVLRRMFVKIISTAMNSDTIALAHPAFVEIAKQLSPDDAKLLAYIRYSPNGPLLPVAEVRDQSPTGFITLVMHESILGTKALLT